MVPIGWDPTLETGDAVVDQQHRDVISLINEVEALESDDTATLLGIVERLVSHIDIHFVTEEDLMRRGGYPREAFETHQKEHTMLKARAASAALGFRGSWDTTRGPFVDFLSVWLLDHIENQDRKMIDFMRRKGDSATPTA
jgi:hemerythrin